jgi:hypothetical protein
MLACSYLHGSTMAMCRPRRLCPFAVKKRIEGCAERRAPQARFGSPQM